jgi:hypothetical protein
MFMNKNLLGIIGVVALVSTSVLATQVDTGPVYYEKGSAPNTRATYPSAFSVELLGRGMLYSINFDQVVDEDVAAGFGFGSVGTETGPNAVMVPAYMNYYFQPTANSLYATAGVNLVINSNNVEDLQASTGGIVFPRSTVMPQFGLGYENRGDNGFLFRVAAYGILAKEIRGWMGFTFGFAM